MIHEIKASKNKERFKTNFDPNRRRTNLREINSSKKKWKFFVKSWEKGEEKIHSSQDRKSHLSAMTVFTEKSTFSVKSTFLLFLKRSCKRVDFTDNWIIF